MSEFLVHGSGETPLDARSLSKLRWRCRRGLLENDLFISSFFDRHAPSLTMAQARGLNELMNLADNDLLDLLLRRKEPGAELGTSEVNNVLEMLRNAPQGVKRRSPV